MRYIRIFKKAIALTIVTSFYAVSSSAELMIIPACEDVYAVTLTYYKIAEQKWYNPFLKFDISGIPSSKQIDSVFLPISPYSIPSSIWDSDVWFWNVNNQEWTESIHPCSLWSFPTSDSTLQDSGFGTVVGEVFSIDLKPIFLRDYDSSHTYCSIKMKDPDDWGFNGHEAPPTSFATLMTH